LGWRVCALELKVKLTVCADVVTVPEVDEALSQRGVVIEYFTLPYVALSV
jgi:hypothetical protein